MKCFHNDCLCARCIRWKKECHRRVRCLEKQKAGFCGGVVTDCKKFAAAPKVQGWFERMQN